MVMKLKGLQLSLLDMLPCQMQPSKHLAKLAKKQIDKSNPHTQYSKPQMRVYKVHIKLDTKQTTRWKNSLARHLYRTSVMPRLQGLAKRQ